MTKYKKSYDRVHGKIILDVQDHYGSTYYLYNDKLHRDDGKPAFISPFDEKKWYKNGELHREDGPAIEWADGTVKYFLHGARIHTKKEWEKLLSLPTLK